MHSEAKRRFLLADTSLHSHHPSIFTTENNVTTQRPVIKVDRNIPYPGKPRALRLPLVQLRIGGKSKVQILLDETGVEPTIIELDHGPFTSDDAQRILNRPGIQQRLVELMGWHLEPSQ
jgi:hypothetical protein